jgi:hypothetical protein
MRDGAMAVSGCVEYVCVQHKERRVYRYMCTYLCISPESMVCRIPVKPHVTVDLNADPNETLGLRVSIDKVRPLPVTA